jgi:5-methylcytosine-specific restriction endonuclease McrA
VFVLDRHGQPLMPCHPARARQLLDRGRARVARLYPFTVRLIDREVQHSEVDAVTVKIDPGSKATGIAVTCTSSDGVVRGLAAVQVRHRGARIRKKLQARAAYRRGRRSRNLRYRPPRFRNRARSKGWLAPSLRHRVENVTGWVERLQKLAPVTAIVMELVRFDTQALENPEIGGIEYQHGTLAGFEVREYLLAKWGRRCAYCDATDTALNIDHIVARSQGGSDRICNLTLACVACNQAKSNLPVAQFVTDTARLAKILASAKKPLRDAAAVNATRWELYSRLTATGLPVSVSTGGRTKWNRARFGLPKSHTLDALAVGEIDGIVSFPADVLVTTSYGRGTYQRTIPDKYGFPRLIRPRTKRHHGFATGDLVRAVVPTGKKQGTHTGRVAVRATGSFNITTAHETVQGIAHRHCQLLHHNDGWNYSHRKEAALLPALKDGTSARKVQ